MFLIDRNSHYYMYLKKTAGKYFKENVCRCLEFLLSTLNFVSERPAGSLPTHMGLVQVDFMLGSELCSRKEHTH